MLSEYERGRSRWMVCTPKLTAGFDVGNIGVVISTGAYGITDFYQTAGRAGRNGQIADIYLLWSGSLSQRLSLSLDRLRAPGGGLVAEEVKSFQRSDVEAFIGYGSSGGVCLRSLLSSFFDGQPTYCLSVTGEGPGHAPCGPCASQSHQHQAHSLSSYIRSGQSSQLSLPRPPPLPAPSLQPLNASQLAPHQPRIHDAGIAPGAATTPQAATSQPSRKRPLSNPQHPPQHQRPPAMGRAGSGASRDATFSSQLFEQEMLDVVSSGHSPLSSLGHCRRCIGVGKSVENSAISSFRGSPTYGEHGNHAACSVDACICCYGAGHVVRDCPVKKNMKGCCRCCGATGPIFHPPGSVRGRGCGSAASDKIIPVSLSFIRSQWSAFLEAFRAHGSSELGDNLDVNTGAGLSKLAGWLDSSASFYGGPPYKLHLVFMFAYSRWAGDERIAGWLSDSWGVASHN